MTVLNRVKTQEFYLSLGYELPPDSMRLLLLRTPEYVQFQREFASGQITNAQIETFVADLLRSFRRGERFKFDLTLAFLSVAMEKVKNTYAETFIQDLSRVHVAELPLSPRVAAVCQSFRTQLASFRAKVFQIGVVNPGHVRVSVGRANAGSNLTLVAA